MKKSSFCLLIFIRKKILKKVLTIRTSSLISIRSTGKRQIVQHRRLSEERILFLIKTEAFIYTYLYENTVKLTVRPSHSSILEKETRSSIMVKSQSQLF